MVSSGSKTNQVCKTVSEREYIILRKYSLNIEGVLSEDYVLSF
jgi:hypothetical protein